MFARHFSNFPSRINKSSVCRYPCDGNKADIVSHHRLKGCNIKTTIFVGGHDVDGQIISFARCKKAT